MNQIICLRRYLIILSFLCATLALSHCFPEPVEYKKVIYVNGSGTDITIEPYKDGKIVSDLFLRIPNSQTITKEVAVSNSGNLSYTEYLLLTDSAVVTFDNRVKVSHLSCDTKYNTIPLSKNRIPCSVGLNRSIYETTKAYVKTNSKNGKRHYYTSEYTFTEQDYLNTK